jgi:hypothetical protein
MTGKMVPTRTLKIAAVVLFIGGCDALVSTGTAAETSTAVCICCCHDCPIHSQCHGSKA